MDLAQQYLAIVQARTMYRRYWELEQPSARSPVSMRRPDKFVERVRDLVFKVRFRSAAQA